MEILATHLRAPGGATGALRQELADLFRSGRVLAGIVLEAPSTGGVLLGIGPHRVLADTQVELEVGRHLLLRVASEKNGVVLDVLGGGEALESALLRMLRGVLGDDRPVGELLHDLAVSLRAAGGERETRLGGFLASHVFEPGAGGEALKALIESNGLGYEGALRAALSQGNRPLEPQTLSALLENLKARLLAELESSSPGPLREAVSRALAGLEAEQLLNLARREAGEPLHFSFPVPDGAQWTTAHVFWRPKQGDGGEGDSSGGETRHVSVGVSFQSVGPIRIDVWMRAEGTSLRIFTEREDVAERIRADLPLLGESLARGGRPVQIVVGVAAPEVVELEHGSMDIRYLREHHLMDVSG